MNRNQATFGLIRWSAIVAIVLLAYVGGQVHSHYFQSWPLVLLFPSNGEADSHDHAEDDHDKHDHDHAHDHASEDSHAHADAKDALELSEASLKNLGLTEDFLKPIELQPFQRTISVPAIVVDRPGRTRLPVSASMTGIVTHVHAVSGETLKPGDLILEMRLTHEDLVSAQKEFLQSLGDLDIEQKEILRIEELASSGALSNKTLLERQYSRDKVESLLRSQREALRLHGLSNAQIEKIERDRRLLTEIKIIAPLPDDHSEEELPLSLIENPKRESHLVLTAAKKSLPVRHVNAKNRTFDLDDSSASDDQKKDHAETLLVLQELHVQKGQIVNAGDPLCTLADYQDLLIEGQAFESESHLIANAKLGNWKLNAILETGGSSQKITDLELGWMNNEIDASSRVLKFYVLLPNELLQDSQNASGQRHIVWKYRIGQRMQLQVPVEQWVEQIVLPIDAVVREGVQSFAFQQNGDHFQRVEVHEKYRDSVSVVIENDGSIFPGDVVALRGAHQMQMALKNKAGGPVDPHAGHQH